MMNQSGSYAEFAPAPASTTFHIPGHTCAYAYDTVSDHQSTTNIAKILDPNGHINLLWPLGDYPNIPKSVHQTKVSVAVVHEDKTFSEFGYAWFRLFGYGLQQGWLTGHSYEVCDGGLQGVKFGLKNLMNGKASAVKYVFGVADTPCDGAGRESIRAFNRSL
jgi:NADPH2:quinone reductase